MDVGSGSPSILHQDLGDLLGLQVDIMLHFVGDMGLVGYIDLVVGIEREVDINLVDIDLVDIILKVDIILRVDTMLEVDIILVKLEVVILKEEDMNLALEYLMQGEGEVYNLVIGHCLLEVDSLDSSF